MSIETVPHFAHMAASVLTCGIGVEAEVKPISARSSKWQGDSAGIPAQEATLGDPCLTQCLIPQSASMDAAYNKFSINL